MDANEAASLVSTVIRRLTFELGLPVFLGVAAGAFMKLDALQMLGMVLSFLMCVQWISGLVWPDDYNLLEWPLICLPIAGLWLIDLWFGFIARVNWDFVTRRDIYDPVPTRFPMLANTLAMVIPALPFVYQTVVSLMTAAEKDREGP